MEHRPPSIPRRIVYSLLATFILLASIEFVCVTFGLGPPPPSGLAVWKPEQEPVLQSYPDTFRLSLTWLWEPKPGAIAEGEAINEDGYRGPHYPRERGAKLRIATMGDSSTFGFGLPESDSWSRRLEAALAERGVQAEVLNFGVVGFSAAQGALYYVGKVRDFRPDVVIAAFGTANDAVVVPPGTGDAEKLLRMSQTSARVVHFLERYAFVRWLRSIAPGNTNAPPAAGGLVQARVPLQAFSAALESLAASVAADGGKCMLVSPPRRVDCEMRLPTTQQYSSAIFECAKRRGIPSVDVRRLFRDREAELSKEAGGQAFAPDRSPLFIDAYHPSKDGHLLYAKRLADELERLGWTKRG